MQESKTDLGWVKEMRFFKVSTRSWVKTFLKFCDIEIEKQKFHSSKKGIHVNKVNTNKIVVSEAFTYGNYDSKFFIDFKIKEKITPLCVLTPVMRGYVRHFDDVQTMSFLIDNKNLLLKYKEIWKIIENIFKRKISDSEPVFNHQYTKTKIISYNNSIKTIFKNVDNNNNEMPKERITCICLSAIVIDSIFNSTTTTTSVLMPLFQLTGVSNFCSDPLSPFLLIVRILFSQTMSFQILLYALFPQILWSTLLPFPSYFNFRNFTYLGIDVSTHDMTIPLQTALNYHVLNLPNNTHHITKNISQHPINQSHPTHPDHTMLHLTQLPQL